MRGASILLGAALALVGSGAVPQAAPPAAYEKDIRPLLAKYCFGCHGAAKPKADLNLEALRDEAGLKARRTW